MSLANSAEKLFPLPVLVAAILNFGIQPKSGYVDISKSDLVEKVGVAAVEIVSLSQAVQKLFPLPFLTFYGRYLGFSVEGDVGFFWRWPY